MNDNVKPELLSVADRLASLPDEVQQLFADDKHGTPDNISKVGCLALARLGKDVWNYWRLIFPVTNTAQSHLNNADFSGLDFRNCAINFSGFLFGENANFIGAIWGDGACFDGAEWGDGARFIGACWGSAARFVGAKFGCDANFVCARWGDLADFSGVQCGRDTCFEDTHWGHFAMFEGAQWGASISFAGAFFGEFAVFKAIGWNEVLSFLPSDLDKDAYKRAAEAEGMSPDSFGDVDFSGAFFVGEINFSGRSFLSKANFGHLRKDYKRRSIKRDESGRVKFDENGALVWKPVQGQHNNVFFGKPPIFHGCELHQDTSFYGAEFPVVTGSDEAARAYRTLKLAFSKQQALREEQRFFRLEMAEEAKQAGRTRWLYWLYGTLSDYGFSLWRPSVAFVLLLLVFAQFYGHYSSELPSCWLFESACVALDKQYEFSLAQALPFSGFDKLEYFKNGSDSLFKDVPVWLLAIHKAISLTLIFLAGLALRNLFRLK